MTIGGFPALPGFYGLLFLHLEPLSTISPAVMAWIYPGALWFFQELLPATSSISTPAFLNSREKMAVLQLSNCYLLLGLISSLVFRAVRNSLPGNAVAQERIIGASLTALAIADLTHILATFIALPDELKFAPLEWNSMTHGNITFVIGLFLARMAWFAGIGRQRYYYGQTNTHREKLK
ncbi:hypothetical protein BDQ17DRAFT_1340983 [Cyathus striatus]|nr:hypothetical protein BDQ17DRAFT_1340983 [Cyathus striatus]